MKGGLELSTTMIILLVLGVIVLMLGVGILLSSSETVNDVADQNELYDCCKKLLANGCTDLNVECSSTRFITTVADEIDVSDPKAFCGCP